MEILYKVHNNLYVNMTNKCPFACTFCLRQTMDRIGESDRLWLGLALWPERGAVVQ